MANQRTTKVINGKRTTRNNDRSRDRWGGTTRVGEVHGVLKMEGSQSLLRLISSGTLKGPGDLKEDSRIRHHGAKDWGSNTIRLRIKAKLKGLGSRSLNRVMV